MRICMYSGVFFPSIGGVPVVVDTLAEELMARGHEVLVLTPLRHGGKVERSFPITFYRRPWGHRRWPQVHALAVLNAYRRFKFEVLLAVPALPMMCAALTARRFADFAVVGWCHGGEMNPGDTERLDERSLCMITRAFRRVDSIIAISDCLRRRILHIVGEACPAIDVIPEPYDPVALEGPPDARRGDEPPVLADHQGLTAGGFVLSISRLERLKNLSMALAAVDRLRSLFEKRGILYVVCGDGDCRSELERDVHKRHLQEIVRFVGMRTGDDKRWLLANSRFLVSTSENEAFGISVVESLHFGRPVLVSDGPHIAHREIIGGRGCGRLFPHDDLDLLVKEMQFMIEADLTEMSARAITAREDFTPETVTRNYERVLASIVENRASAKA